MGVDVGGVRYERVGGHTCAGKRLARGTGAESDMHRRFGSLVSELVLVNRGVSGDPVEIDGVGSVDDDIAQSESK